MPKTLTLLQPKSQSLEDFRKFIDALGKHLGISRDGPKMTDEEWAEKHKRFWAKKDAQ